MCDETTNHGCCEPNPPWEPPQVIPAQMRRVNNLIFRKINQFHRENGVGAYIRFPYRYNYQNILHR